MTVYSRLSFPICIFWTLISTFAVCPSLAFGKDKPQITLRRSSEPFQDHRSVAFSPDGKSIVKSCSFGDKFGIKLLDADTLKEKASFQNNELPVLALCYLSDHLLVSGSRDETFSIWDLKEKKLLRTIHQHSFDVCDLTVSKDRKLLVSGSLDDFVKLWDVETFRLLRTFKLSGGVNSVAISSGGNLLAMGGFDGEVVVLDIESGKEIISVRTLKKKSIDAVLFSPDGKKLLFAGEQGFIYVYDVLEKKELHKLPAHANGVFCLAFSPDGKWLLSGEYDALTVWDPETFKECVRIKEGQVLKMAFHPDGKSLATIGVVHKPNPFDAALKLWDFKAPK